MQGAWHNTSDVLAAFIAFEEREQMFERRTLGVEYWQLIRHDVFRETIEALGLAQRAHLRLEELPLGHWLGPQLRHLRSTFERSRFVDLPKADLLVSAHPRHVLYQGRYICPYTQPLLWGTERSRLVLEGQFQGRYFDPGAGENTRYVDMALVLAHARFRLRELRGHGLPVRTRSEIAAFTQGLRVQLGAAPDVTAVERRVRTAVLTALGLTPQLEQLMDQVQPRLIVNVVGYRLVNQVLTLLARKRGVLVAEAQHGTLGAAHAGYNFAPGRRPASFPDRLLLFGEIWRKVTPHLPLPAAETPAIGYGWLELQRSQFERAPSSAKKRVIFLSQRGIGHELARIAVTLHRSASELEIVYRLHPSEGVEWRHAYPELARSGIRVEQADERALYASQNDADAQVGVFSTALLEGVAFGLETYLVALPGHEQLLFLTDAGIARTVAGANDLARLLREAPPPTAAASAALWTPNPRERFAAFVEDALARPAADTDAPELNQRPSA